VLLHGPPGTGKTLIARKLAQSSGMDYAIMSGGDVGPLGEDAVNQLHSLFKWASRSQNGLLLFIDETEAFLGSRERLMGAENAHIRHALNALLYQTGTHSNKFMLVLATNRPEELDAAILDRLDVSMTIGLPALDQRSAILSLYMDTLTTKSTANIEKNAIFGYSTPDDLKFEEGCSSHENIRSMAKKMEGFSGREISKFVIALHHTSALLGENVISKKLIETVLIQKVKEHQQKFKVLSSS
jgi:ATPase family AAA domain-containing protein 3A/B